jgi:hypothetical protein
MKKIFVFLFVLVMVLGVSMQAHAALSNRGTDINGNRLIYDSDLNITWYDYTNSMDNWNNQMNWASALSVSGGDLVGVYDDWRLPSTVDGPDVWGYDGTTIAGYNITSSEMGHLFYAELGNKGYYDTSGNFQPGLGLTKTGDFQNLQSYVYWSGTEYAANTNYAWLFHTGNGNQFHDYKVGNVTYAIAVRPGDVSVAVVPEPVSMILFGIGGVVLGARRMVKRRRG